MSASICFKENFNSEKAKGALEDILAAFEHPENYARVQNAKDVAGNDMLKHMQVVFPLLTQIKMEVIENYGFTPDGEGVLQFAQLIRQLEREHPDVARLNAELRAQFIPPMVPPSLPDH
ncbi:protein C10 [Ixodes scapularis]|uniref:Protein C10 n=2 Tax=Ixodes TaxID=6944 RepID=B7PA87_IXOSC|nr:protein C10 [Ixodes scapularis]EEC03509.1 protein C10, putative [Ixodes scapularis]|eukprot:XP_002406656.1 protein C10, putative [Ixodes scapularis]